ncbi:MAG: DUF4129 domain-containing protein [Promethearchaeota archaeon]
MNTKDFNFLQQKEFVILCFLLLSLTFAQIALGQLSSNNMIKPFMTLNISLFEIIGLFLPLFTGIYLFFSNKSNRQFSPLPLIIFIGVTLISCFIIALLGITTLPEEESPVLPEINTSTPITTTMATQKTTGPVLPPPQTIESGQPDFNFFLNFLLELRSLFLIVIILLPLFLILLSRRKSIMKRIALVDTDKSPVISQERDYRMRTVLECYYQASTSLEERGANNSPSLTPTEFHVDVVTKTLSPPPLIDDLTNLFEEAKFSNHSITDQKVDQAKSLASKIIFSSDLSSDLNECKEPEEIE